MAIGAPSPTGVGMLLLGVVVLVLGRRFRGYFAGAPYVQLATGLLRENKPDAAVDVVASLGAKASSAGPVRRGVALVRANAALLEGHAALAEREASSALEGATQLFFEGAELQQRARALGVRALARVAQGNLDGATADAAAVVLAAEAEPHALAEARLAEALVLVRRADTPALAQHLDRHAGLLLEHCPPRERAVVRALRRLVHARKTSVYREPAQREARVASGGRLTEWAGTFAPDLAEFVVEEATTPVVPPPFAPGPSPAATLFGKPDRSAARVLGLWGALIVMFLAIWQFLTPAERVPPPPRDEAAERARAAEEEQTSSTLFSLQMGAAVLVFASLVVLMVRKQRHADRELAAGRRALATGDEATGERRLESVAKTSRLWLRTNGPYAALAGVELARLAERRGDFVGALDRCEAALVALDRTAGGRRGASDFVLPTVLCERAVALAGMGKVDTSALALGQLRVEIPDFHDLPTAVVRARLVGDVVRGDWASAAEAARMRTSEMPLPLREDLLADVVLAANGVLAKDERERIAAELASHTEAAAWIDRLAPGLRASVTGAPS